jgi:hypothetical protein
MGQRSSADHLSMPMFPGIQDSSVIHSMMTLPAKNAASFVYLHGPNIPACSWGAGKDAKAPEGLGVLVTFFDGALWTQPRFSLAPISIHIDRVAAFRHFR